MSSRKLSLPPTEHDRSHEEQHPRRRLGHGHQDYLEDDVRSGRGGAFHVADVWFYIDWDEPRIKLASYDGRLAFSFSRGFYLPKLDWYLLHADISEYVIPLNWELTSYDEEYTDGYFLIIAAHWFYLTIFATFAALSWIKWRFSLRTLLIVLTLFEVFFGAIAISIRG